jgi:hypothetical protein
MLVKKILNVPDRPSPVMADEVHVSSFIADFNSTFSHDWPPDSSKATHHPLDR